LSLYVLVAENADGGVVIEFEFYKKRQVK